MMGGGGGGVHSREFSMCRNEEERAKNWNNYRKIK
jgi:hypothetical protein